jgi:hypothetical protein
MKPEINALLIFLRYPEPGWVKKRLSESIGPERAAEVYEKLIRRTLGIVWDFKRMDSTVQAFIFHTPEDSVEKLRRKFRGPWEFYSQQGEHLGERMRNALRFAFSMGARKAVLIGTDLADIETMDLEGAFQNAEKDTVVLGPAADGGFYLIGTGRPIGAALDFNAWGTGDVFSRTANELKSSGFHVHLATMRKDVDRGSDFDRVSADPMFSGSISIIIPTLSDLRTLSPFLEYLKDSMWPGDEIVVVQGGAFAKTSVRRISPSLTFVFSPKGRGVQQNTGAMIAKGTIVFFLHDDTVPPPDFGYLIRRAGMNLKAELGCFKLAFTPSNRALRLISGWANLRTLLFKLPYGDQGLFCKREVFERVGGFGRRYLMEDIELARKLKKAGQIAIVPVEAYSSADRYLNKGILKASLQNHLLALLNALGRDERDLYRRYYGLEPE